MTKETDAEFLEELAASFSADSSFDVEDRLRAIAARLSRMEYALRAVKRTAKASVSCRRKVSASWLVARASSGLSLENTDA